MSAEAVFEVRSDPGGFASALLAAVVHLLLFAVLVFGVRWQNRPPESIAVELWEAPTPAPLVESPKPLPQAEPVKPEPVIPKPDIAEKVPPPKPVPKAEPLKPKVDETKKRIREELAREQTLLALDRERQQIKDQLAREADAARNKAIADWVSKVRAKIRGNVVLPPDIKGNPEAVFDVVQLPTGEVLSVKLRKSSGHQALDDAIERAILKSSPLPRPDRSDSAPRAFELKYRPVD